MKKLLDKCIPSFARWPLLVLLVFNMLAFYLPGKIIPLPNAYDLSTPWDEALPLCSFFIVFYVLAWIQWFVGYIYHCGESRELCSRFVTADVLAKALCALCFVLIPCTIARPEVTGNSVFDWGVRLIYAVDTPTNLFPSVHCLESWMCFRMALMTRGPRSPRWYIIAQLVLTLGVFASTVLLKQHFLVDIIAGVAVGEIGLLLSGPCGLWRVCDRWIKGGVKRGK